MGSDISTIDGPDTRNTSHKQDKNFGLSYKIFQFSIRRNTLGFFLYKKCVQWEGKQAKNNYNILC